MKRPWKLADTLCLLLGAVLLCTVVWRALPQKEPTVTVTVRFRAEIHHPALEDALADMTSGTWNGTPVERITVLSVSPRLLPPSQTGAAVPLPSALTQEAEGTFICRGCLRDGCFFASGAQYLAPGMHAPLSDGNAVFWVEILSILPNSS